MTNTDSWIFESIHKYGMDVVLFGVLLLLFGIMAKVIIQKNNEMMKTIINDKSAYEKHMRDTIDKMLEDRLSDNNNHQQEESSGDLMSTFAKLSKAIRADFDYTMKSICCDRLAIYLFHNGTYNPTGIHFFKTTCICEKVKIASCCKERAIEHSALPISLFNAMIGSLIDASCYTLNNTDDILNTTVGNIMFSSYKVSTSMAYPVFDNNNALLGFILAEFEKSQSEDTLNNKRVIIKDFIKKLSPILMFSGYTEIAKR